MALSSHHFLTVDNHDTLIVVVHLLSLQVVGDNTLGFWRNDAFDASVQCADELHLVNVTVAIGDGEAQDLLTLSQVLGQCAFHDLIGAPAASSCHLDGTYLGHGAALYQTNLKATVRA